MREEKVAYLVYWRRWKRWWSFGWPTLPPLLFVSLFFFFGKVSPSGWGKASFLLRGSGKNLKSSSGFFMSFSFPVLPLFRLCSSPARSCAFYVFVSCVHPCSKSLSISLCLTLPCICPFLFFSSLWICALKAKAKLGVRWLFLWFFFPCFCFVFFSLSLTNPWLFSVFLPVLCLLGFFPPLFLHCSSVL